MYQLIVILLLVARVEPEPKSFQHEYYVSRQSRDNAAPTQTGYVFSRTDDKPATFASLANHPSASAAITDGTMKLGPDISTTPVQSDETDPYKKSLLRKYTDMPPIRREPFKMISTVGNLMFTGVTESMPFSTKSWGTHSLDYEIAKAKSKLGIEPAMSIKADKAYMKQNVANIEHKYAPADTSAVIKPVYDFNRVFHIDDDDVKTLSGTTLDWWPYFMHSPYEYESIKMDSEIQKAKEKRYAIASSERVIPVHEGHEDYSHLYEPRHIEPHYDTSAITDSSHNSGMGNQGYVSYDLKDFDSKYDSDPLELNWNSAFDANDDVGNNIGKRNRRLHDDSHLNLNAQQNIAAKSDASSKALGDSAHEKGYEKKHEFDKHESGDSKNYNHNTNKAQSENNEAAYKDVVDQFANRYGGEDHKRHSAFALKRNSDNGEKKKGFHRVYHKDEYQEDNEYYDNTNNSAKAEDSGSSIAHLGGSAAAIQSHAAAAAGNKANAFNDVENMKKNGFENNHKGHDAKKGLDRDYNRYRDLVHNTADRGDYVYRYP